MRQGDMTLGELIEIVRVRTDRAESFEVYSTWDDYDAFDAATMVRVVSPADLYRDAENVPGEIAARGLWMFCEGDLLEDVVANAVLQKPDISVAEIVAGLEHYLVNDAFRDDLTGEPTGQGGRAIWGGGKLGRVGRLAPDGTPKRKPTSGAGSA